MHETQVWNGFALNKEQGDWLSFERVRAGVSKSSYIGISIPIKYSNFSRFYKKLGPFYKKLRCDKFGN